MLLHSGAYKHIWFRYDLNPICVKNLIKHNLLCYCHIGNYIYIQTQKVRFWTYFSNIWISSDYYKLFLIIQYHRSQTKTTKQAHQNMFDLNKNSRQLGTQAHYAK